ncbi:methyl-accepting chemotaxis protein [Roseateles flavus]|uniref:Methyl-accepting chemotaxis protein n=1 Tax=Roseateles flavus TaxID=3149041 RepID=A0ABV0G915_9BURK
MTLDKLKVSTRLNLLAGVLGLLLFLVGAIALLGLERSNEALRTVYEDSTVPMGQLGEINALILHNRVAINAVLVTPTDDVVKTQTADIEANIAKAGKLWDVYMATSLSPEEAKLAKDFAEKRKAFVAEALLPIVAAQRAGDFQGAHDLVATKLRSMAAPLESSLAALIQLQIDVAKKKFEDGESRYHFIRSISIGMVVGGLLFAIVFATMVVRSFSRQLGGEPGYAARIAQQVAAGELSVPITVRAGDTASLMAQLKAMQDSLADVVSKVRSNAESVATASAQIAQGNQDLSSRTEEQASALQQTAASMDQLGSTISQNADNARQANQLALGASTVAVKGGEVVGRVVETMKGINDSSKKIADIIGVIDGIAFQTNILALNAAVEAARAGEQGRGFAVVAGEVRNLAQRSAEAAKEIKSLITASVERVEQGSVLVDEAGTTMTEIVNSIRRVTDIMGEISSASAEQSSGVAQIGGAVSQMDQATQQNAALVEESAAAAESLKAQANGLVEAVAVFKLAHAATGAAPRVRAAAGAARLSPSLATVAKPKGAAKVQARRAPAPAADKATFASPGADEEWASF